MRTFLAIEIPPAVHTVIRQTQQEIETLLAAAHHGHAIRWTAPAAVHLTVRFLGETTEEQRRQLQEGCLRLAARQKPFTLTVQEAGCFPNVQAPNIIWLGLQPADQTLLQLQAKMEQVAQAVGFAAEPKPFRPHLTIGRLRHTIERPQQRAIGQILARALATIQPSHPPTTTFVVTHIVHMQSQLEPTGARYIPLQVFKFSEAA